jgi:hypothetical protein
MDTHARAAPWAVMLRLQKAINQHDLEGVVAYVTPDYQREQPLHPSWTFQGREQFCTN